MSRQILYLLYSSKIHYFKKNFLWYAAPTSPGYFNLVAILRSALFPKEMDKNQRFWNQITSATNLAQESITLPQVKKFVLLFHSEMESTVQNALIGSP